MQKVPGLGPSIFKKDQTISDVKDLYLRLEEPLLVWADNTDPDDLIPYKAAACVRVRAAGISKTSNWW